jgi:FK506-binding protein 4/5
MRYPVVDPDSLDPAEFMGPDDVDDDDDDFDPQADRGRVFDLTGDGGVIKTITLCGTGTAVPGPHAEVFLHYTGRLADGTEFATTRLDAAPTMVPLGLGRVVPAWELALRTMKRGERADIRCTADHGYGAKGRPPTVPPDAALLFDVEVLSWREWEDVTEAKDGHVMKKTLVEPVDPRVADFDATVDFSWSLRLKEGDAAELGSGRQTATIGDETVRPRGLERSLQAMGKGEEALVLLDPAEGFGAEGDAALGVPAATELLYTVTVHDIHHAVQPWEVEELSARVLEAQRLKTEGNELFKTGLLSRAVKKYRFALSFVDSEFTLSAAERAERRPIRAAIHLNLAACSIKAGVWESAVEHCTDALALDPGNPKALLRRGKAYGELGQWREARLDLGAAIDATIGVDKTEAQKELAKVQKAERAQDEKERKSFQGLFAPA